MADRFLAENLGVVGFGGDGKHFMAAKELLDNAADSVITPEAAGSHISVNVRISESELGLTVADQGGGVNVETLEALGKAFCSGKRNSGPTKGCFGIGLKALMQGLNCNERNPLCMSFSERSADPLICFDIYLGIRDEEVVVFHMSKTDHIRKGVTVSIQRQPIKKKNISELKVKLIAYMAAMQVYPNSLEMTLVWEDPSGCLTLQFSHENWIANRGRSQLRWLHRLHEPSIGGNMRMPRILEDVEALIYRRTEGSLGASGLLYARDEAMYEAPCVANVNKSILVRIQLARIGNLGLLQPTGTNCTVVAAVDSFLRQHGVRYGIKNVGAPAASKYTRDIAARSSWLLDHWSVEWEVRVRQGAGWDNLAIFLYWQADDGNYADLQKNAVAAGSKLLSEGMIGAACQEIFQRIAKSSGLLCSLESERLRIAQEVFIPAILQYSESIAKRSSNRQLMELLGLVQMKLADNHIGPSRNKRRRTNVNLPECPISAILDSVGRSDSEHSDYDPLEKHLDW